MSPLTNTAPYCRWHATLVGTSSGFVVSLIGQAIYIKPPCDTQGFVPQMQPLAGQVAIVLRLLPANNACCYRLATWLGTLDGVNKSQLLPRKTPPASCPAHFPCYTKWTQGPRAITHATIKASWLQQQQQPCCLACCSKRNSCQLG